MSDLYGVIGTSTYANLLADPEGADVISVPCKPGNGALTAGTLLYRGADGLYAPAATAQVTASNMLVVLAEDVSTGEAPASGSTAVAEDAKAYRAGIFVDGTVKLAAGASLTAESKAVLRGQNIVFDKKESAETFTNTVKGA
jgi:hypothetical protein